MKENTWAGRVLRTGYMLCWSFFLIIFLDALRIRTVSGEILLIDVSPALPALGAFLLLITDTVCRTVSLAVSSGNRSPAGMYASLGNVLRRYDLKGLCAALLFGLVMYAAERSLFWLGMVPFFAAGSLFDKKTWLKPMLCTFLLRLALQISLFALGLTEETVFTFSYGTCHSLGFENPNTTGLLVFLSFTLAWYICADRKTSWYLSSVLLAAAVYLINGCRSAAVLFLLLPVLHAAVGTDRIRDSRILGRLYIWLPPLCALMSFVLGFALIPLDGKTGGNFLCRFVEGIYAWNDFGVSLFGRVLPASERVYYFDNAYVNLLYIHGILSFTAMLTVWKEAFRRIAGTKDRKMIVLSVLYCALLTMESCTYELSLIPLMFLFGNSPGQSICHSKRGDLL